MTWWQEALQTINHMVYFSITSGIEKDFCLPEGFAENLSNVKGLSISILKMMSELENSTGKVWSVISTGLGGRRDG